MYDFQRCPKIVAIKAYNAFRAVREEPPPEPVRQLRFVEPATIGSIGEAAVKLGLAGVPISRAIQQIALKIPQVNVSNYLRQIAIESLAGVEVIRKNLAERFGDIAIIGKGEGRNPDLAGTVQPDYIAFPSKGKEPIIVESKDTTRQSPEDRFQAMFYNGVADKYGVYLVEQRVEHGSTALAPKIIRSKALTILVYPRLAQFSIINEKFVPSLQVIKQAWEAKQLGLKGLTPETGCDKKCAHYRLKIDLSEGTMEPLPPPALLFSQGMIEKGYDLDTHYQADYAWKLLPAEAKHAIFSQRLDDNGIDSLKNWLINVAGLSSGAADITVDLDKRGKFLSSKPDAEKLMRFLKDEIGSWREILKKRFKTSAPSILGRATSVYPLPHGSHKFVKDTRKRWK
jgi:hypothetical protein